MEEKHSRKNSRNKVAGETKQVAEAEKQVVGIPVVLEVVEVEVPVAIRIVVEVWHPVVAIGIAPFCNVQYTFRVTEDSIGHLLYFIWSQNARKHTAPTNLIFS